ALVARTGYTGEDGFEIFVESGRSDELWAALTESGQGQGMLPCGLGARDTLRLEAGMPVYGNELDPGTNPFEAGLGRVAKLDKGPDLLDGAAFERDAREDPTKRPIAVIARERGRPGSASQWS